MLLAMASSLAIATFLPAVGITDETFEQRRARLEQMSPVDKNKLLVNQKRLEQMKTEEQQQLRELERQLAGDPQGDRLRSVMLHYHKWLRSLSTSERAEFLSLNSDEERVARIKASLEKQETERLEQLAKASLSPEDADRVRSWFGELVMRRRSELLRDLPGHLRERLFDSDDPRRLVLELSNHLRDKGTGPPLIRIMEQLKIDESERAELIGKLTLPAADVYRQQVNEQDKQRVLQNWVSATMFRPRMPSSDELRELLNNLSPEERDRIENLPPEQMKAELTRHFFFDRMRRWSSSGKGPERKRPPQFKSDSETRDR
jgi:hypothetical protein